MRAVGVAHMLRMTWLNRSAVSGSRMTTDAFGPMLAHNCADGTYLRPPRSA